MAELTLRLQPGCRAKSIVFESAHDHFVPRAVRLLKQELKENYTTELMNTLKRIVALKALLREDIDAHGLTQTLCTWSGTERANFLFSTVAELKGVMVSPMRQKLLERVLRCNKLSYATESDREFLDNANLAIYVLRQRRRKTKFIVWNRATRQYACMLRSSPNENDDETRPLAQVELEYLRACYKRLQRAPAPMPANIQPTADGMSSLVYSYVAQRKQQRELQTQTA